MRQGLKSRLERLEGKDGNEIIVDKIRVHFSSREELDAKVEELRKRFGFEGYLPESFNYFWWVSKDRNGKERINFRPPLVPDKPPKTASWNNTYSGGQSSGSTNEEQQFG